MKKIFFVFFLSIDIFSVSKKTLNLKEKKSRRSIFRQEMVSRNDLLEGCIKQSLARVNKLTKEFSESKATYNQFEENIFAVEFDCEQISQDVSLLKEKLKLFRNFIIDDDDVSREYALKYAILNKVRKLFFELHESRLRLNGVVFYSLLKRYLNIFTREERLFLNLDANSYSSSEHFRELVLLPLSNFLSIFQIMDFILSSNDFSQVSESSYSNLFYLAIRYGYLFKRDNDFVKQRLSVQGCSCLDRDSSLRGGINWLPCGHWVHADCLTDLNFNGCKFESCYKKCCLCDDDYPDQKSSVCKKFFHKVCFDDYKTCFCGNDYSSRCILSNII